MGGGGGRGSSICWSLITWMSYFLHLVPWAATQSSLPHCGWHEAVPRVQAFLETQLQRCFFRRISRIAISSKSERLELAHINWALPGCTPNASLSLILLKNLTSQELLMALISRWNLGMFPQNWDPNPSHLMPGAKVNELSAPVMCYTE